MMRKVRMGVVCLSIIFLGVGCTMEMEQSTIQKKDKVVNEEVPSKPHISSKSISKNGKWQAINIEGNTLISRINVPKGFHRNQEESGSFKEYIRNYPLKPHNAPILLYSGNRKANQGNHIAVFEMPVIAGDLQQCADSIMRIYAQYYYERKAYDKIAFHFVNGFLCDFKKWAEGYRVHVDGNDVTWVKEGDYDDSLEAFEQYLKVVFSYASTLSMQHEASPKAIEEIQIGDIFLKAGSPGHVVMVVDVCENEVGEKAFLLAQGYMPAQEFHILKHPLHEDDPWYYVSEITYPFITPEYAFEENSLYKLDY